ncbi:MAG: Gfo/Idh/MocA family oxidoreductase [Thaumarchaeota archaeon]|nr:Gfo/Idh/MocA family oxidoreductase [Nitrososphaerota archaeon]
MAPIRVAVLGAGYWGTKLCREYAGIEGSTREASLSMVVDSSEAALEAVRAQVGRAGRVFSRDYQNALRDRSVDVVHVALPSPLHYEVARSALEGGKHVLLEKPMALSSREAYKLASLAEEQGLMLQVGHIFRFNAALRMVRQMLHRGRIGRVYYATLEWTTDDIPSGERDIVFDLAPHPIDVLNYLLDEWPYGVDAVGGSYRRNREVLEEVAFVNLEFPDRVVANVYLSWIQHDGKNRLVRIVGSEGTVICDALNQVVTMYTSRGTSDIPQALFPKLGLNNGDGGWHGKLEDDPPGPNNTIRDMELHFIDAVRGRAP